ncbi:MAG: L-2-hydroxyglutarate oxidase [Chloroflexi bacterium]|nr:L-2-hydroxyglutarate oxidase [Chloroflexota bacterium]MYD47531.1 L-2-hydroxyglutarate oxidase [Chloroflexota bacterium]
MATNGNTTSVESRLYDVAIVGGGIIGLSTAMQLLERSPDLNVAVIEKEELLAQHQTGHNSGVIHSGIYYRPGSWKARFCVGGKDRLIAFCDENEIEYDPCGKVIVATHESELGRLQDLYERGVANGVPDLQIVEPERLAEIEPHTQGVRALWAPHTGIVDYVRVANAYAGKFQSAGGDVFTGAAVQQARQTAGETALETERGALQAKHVINCAGLYADKLARMMGEETDVRIIPFRGEYYKLAESSHHLVKGLIYPVPDPRFPFLGVHYTRNIHGYVEAGPNAVLAWAREGYRKSNVSLSETAGALTFPGFWKMTARHWRTGMQEMHRSYRKSVFVGDLQKLIPEIQASDLEPGGSGVRAQAVASSGAILDDFHILRGQKALHVLNAPSPGATSSLAIGEYLSDMAMEDFGLARP